MYNITSLPDFLYHCTPKRNIEKILKEGLSPNYSNSSLAGVFLALYEDIADNYSFMKDDECVTLKIKTCNINEDFLIPDNYELRDFIEQNYTNFNSYKECNFIDSLNLCGQCAYTLVISPEDIIF